MVVSPPGGDAQRHLCHLPNLLLWPLKEPMRDTWPLLEQIAFPPLRRGRLDTLQVNVGYRCNQSCVHCHVNAGPSRSEEIRAEVIDLVLAFLAKKRVTTLDITGGAPELNPHFRRLVRS